MATFAYNTKVNASTGISPFESWMGRKAKMPIDLIVPIPDRMYKDEHEYIRETQERFNEMFKLMKEKSTTTFHRNARTYSGNTKAYSIGDLVWIFNRRKIPGKPPKLTDAWTGPYKVEKIPADVLLEVTPAETAGRTFTCHISRVRPFSGGGRDQKYRPIEIDGEQLDADEVAEEIGPSQQWIEPLDNLTIPIQVDTEPPIMYDLIREKIKPRQPAPAAEAPPAPAAEPTAAPSRGATAKDPTRHTLPRTCKRSAEDLNRATDKRSRNTGVKREREEPTSGEAEPRRRKTWKELTKEDSDMSNETDTDNDPMAQINQPNEVTIQIPPGITPPERSTTGAAGLDCRANQTLTIPAGKSAKVDIGLRAAIPADWCILLHSRSKLAHEGITVEAGLIDSDYRGAIKCVLHNHTHFPRRIQSGERICQALILSVPTIKWETVAELDATDRDTAGFGSTGHM